MAATRTLPVTELVEVQTSISAPEQSPEQHPNQILICTASVPLVSIADGVKQYNNLDEVGVDYGTISDVYNKVKIMLSQSPNIFSGNGELLIAPIKNAGHATRKRITAAIIAQPQIDAFKLISNGCITIAINDVDYLVSGIDYRNVISIDEVIARTVEALRGVCYCTRGNADQAVFESPMYGTSNFELKSTLTPPQGSTDVGNAEYFDFAAGVATAGVNSVGDKIDTVIASLIDKVKFYTIVTDQKLEPAEVIRVAEYIQTFASGSQPRIFAYAFAETTTPTEITAGQLFATRMQYQWEGTEDMPFAYIGKLCSVNFNIANSAARCFPHGKQLASVGTSQVSLADRERITASGCDGYFSIGTIPTLFASGTNGGYFDELYRTNFLALKLQQEFATLIQSEEPLFNNPQGYARVLATGARVLIMADRCGMVKHGDSWEGIPVGVPPSKEADFRNAMRRQGWFITMPPFATQNPTDAAKRLSPPVNTFVILVGGVNKIIVNSGVKFS